MMKMIGRRARMILTLLLGVVVALALLVVALRLIFPLPPLEPRLRSEATRDGPRTPLGRTLARLTAEGPAGQTGLHLLNDGRSAFAARVALARAATVSLDVQYYIWKGDLSGTLMLEELHKAADRGVRVRLLLDDNGVSGLDTVLAALDSHPSIEVRLFNPFVIRRPKMIGYLIDFPRLNRRMHNKSFTADAQATIIGGRNIGDEYFGAQDDGLFADLDVLAIGAVVGDVEADFDRYWNSASAYPASRILPAVAPERIAELEATASGVERDRDAAAYMAAIVGDPFIEQAQAGTLPLTWAPVELVSDDPAKALGKADEDAMLLPVLQSAIGVPRRDLQLVSGYFVPTAAGVDAFGGMARSGVEVSIMTNAYVATDVGIVHAGYAHRRADLLRQGVRLFEMRPPGESETPSRRVIGTGSGLGSGLGSGSGSGSGSRGGSGSLGGSGSGSGQVLRATKTTLHAKTFAADGQRVFIGSFNFDPRSMHLNTELGFLIESPALARRLEQGFISEIPSRAWEVVLAGDGSLAWLQRDGDRVTRLTEEPGMTRFDRTVIWILSRLPIEWLL